MCKIQSSLCNNSRLISILKFGLCGGGAETAQGGLAAPSFSVVESAFN